MTLVSIKNLIGEEIKEVNRLILANLHSQVPLIEQIGQHIIHGGGKRLRPTILLLAARACGYTGVEHLPLATVIEFIHTATLLHDDVVDASVLRRGQPTANHRWGNQASVLVGDFLYTRAFQLMMQVANMDVLNVMANATNTIAEGEVLQLANKNNPQIEEKDYLQVIHYKTAMLFEAAAEIAAILGELTPSLRKTTAQYGFYLGMAYQLIDDVLDYQTPDAALGKHIGQDLADGKMTLPLIYLLQHGHSSDRVLIEEAIQQGNSPHLEAIQNAIASSGALDYTVNLAKKKAEEAQIAISELPPSESREALIQLADFVVTRTY